MRLEKAKTMGPKNKAKTIVCYSFTENGKMLGEKLAGIAASSEYLHTEIEHIYNAETKGGIKSRVKGDFKNKAALIFISSAGIAVRFIKDFIQDKTRDPAVLVIDDMARFVIPLLSGHLGGANELAKKIAHSIGAKAVITTASDARNIEAVDLFAERNNYEITSMEAAKNITAAMVAGKSIIFYSSPEQVSSIPDSSKRIRYPNVVLYDAHMFNENSEKIKNAGGIIWVSNFKDKLPERLRAVHLPCVKLVRRTLNLGIGLRKGVDEKTVYHAAELALSSIGRDLCEVKTVSSIEIKKEEAGLIGFADLLRAELKFFTQAEIQKTEALFEKSDFVKRTVGVYNVSAPSAYLSGGAIILEKFKYEGVTVSVSE